MNWNLGYIAIYVSPIYFYKLRQISAHLGSVAGTLKPSRDTVAKRLQRTSVVMEVGEKEKKARSSIVRSKEKECSCISSSSLMRILLHYMIKERHKGSLEADILIRNKEIKYGSGREVAYNYVLVCERKDLFE